MEFVIFLVDITEALKKAGFFIITRKAVKLTAEQAAELEKSHQGKDYYDELITYMTRFVFHSISLD